MQRCSYLEDNMSELKISDLSVGDWVRWNDKTYRVCVIDGVSLTVELAEELGGTIEVAIDELIGIPLTPEILEKNGISKTYESDEYAVYKGEGFNVTEYYTELWEFEKHRNRMKIRNVHELQHALRFARIEKTIEL